MNLKVKYKSNKINLGIKNLDNFIILNKNKGNLN